MKLYHGSIHKVKSPVISKGRTNTDFGKGFYTTTSLEQASKWATMKKERELRKDPSKQVKAIVSIYEINEDLLTNNKYKTILFEKPAKEWLEFVVLNRKSQPGYTYDMVMGPVANDTVYAVLALYEQGTLTAEATIDRLKTHKVFDQLSFHTDVALEELRFVETVEVKEVV